MNSSSLLLSAEGKAPDPRIVRIFGEARFHADGELLALAFQADGSLWSIEEPGLLRQWNASGQPCVSHFLSDLETLWTFSPDARLLGSASDELSLWEVASGQFLRSLAQPSWVTALAFRGDGRFVATGHDDGLVRLWEIHNGQLVQELARHERPISALAFSPQGGRLASAAEDKSICVWDLRGDRLLDQITGHTDRIDALAWHPQGHTLASAGWDGTVRLWDADTFKPLILLNYHALQVLALAYSPDGRWLASADSQDVTYVWDVRAGQLRNRFEGHTGQVHCLAFRGDGHRLAIGGAGQVIQVKDLEQVQPVIPEVAPATPVESGFRRQGISLALSRDGSRLAASANHSLQVWETSAAQLLGRTEAPVLLHSVAYSTDGQKVAAGGDDAAIRVYDVAGKLQTTLEDANLLDPVTVLAFAPNGHTLASASSTGISVWLWDVAHKEPVLLIPDALEGCTIEALAFQPQGHLLAVGGIDWLATGGSDGAVALWDIEQRCEIHTFPGGTTSLAFHPSGRWLAAVSLDKSLCIWDVETCDLAREWIASEDNLTCVAYSLDGRWLASGGADRTVRLWEAASGKLLGSAEIKTQVQVLTFSPDGRFLFTGNANQTCYQLEVDRLLAASS
jgi:WD40 repeat protein